MVTKRNGSLGMSIVGGRGQTSHPFGVTEPGIFISKVIITIITFSFCFISFLFRNYSRWGKIPEIITYEYTRGCTGQVPFLLSNHQ